MMKINHHIIITTLVTFCLSVRPASAQGNLIANGSFEDAGGSLNGWNYNGLAYNSIAAASNPNAFDGSFYAHFSPTAYDMSQTITTSSGAYYVLAFAAISIQGTNTFNISIDNAVLAAVSVTSTTPITISGSPYNTSWQNFDYVFESESTNTTITFSYVPQMVIIPFGGTYDSYYGSAGLDAISVTAAPEPSSIALFGAGFFGWLACRKRARVKT